MPEITRVLIVDDHALMREGLRSILERDKRFRVIGEAANAGDALTLIERHRPDIALVDISLPGKSGIELTRSIKKSAPETKVLIVTMHSQVNYIAEAFRAGASGFIVKESASDQLIRGLETLRAGEAFLDSAVSPELVRSLADDGQKPRRISDDAYDSLTAREQEILRLVTEGLSAKEMAARLHISPKTVENHRTNIMRKLDLHTTMDLMRYAARIGLIDLADWARQ